MSSDEEFNDGDKTTNQSKKRRIQRACDICRRKKVRCDGPQMPNNRCSNCIASDFQCTYVEAAKKRGPPKGYVEALETRLDKLQKLLTRFVPDIDFSKELEQPTSELKVHQYDASYRTPTSIATNAIRNSGKSSFEGDEEHDAHIIMPDTPSNPGFPTGNRFFGKSSGALLVQTAINLKSEYVGGESIQLQPPLDFIREEFWKTGSWESSLIQDAPASYKFPDEDLIPTLVDLYFTRANIFYPILHRPTIENALAERKHLKDDGFASIFLLLCAIASRFTEDRRVLLEPNKIHSAGWGWFHQVSIVRKSLLAAPSLEDLQCCCLCVEFLMGSSSPQACWTLVGIGIRFAQDVGAHRRKAQKGAWTIEDELWKRAFWALVTMDRITSAALGRPCATQDEDFDLDLPIECDDEYWAPNENGQMFQQPPNKPSQVAFYNSYLKLNQILAIALRTIYSINKSRILLGFVGPQWEHHIVSELDSALNKWVDSIPDYLRWDPNREDPIFYEQSLALYTSYYNLQILIHRPFIASTRKSSSLSFPSLAICTNAARTIVHMIDVRRLRLSTLTLKLQLPVFTAGIVLLLTIYAGRRSGLATDTSKEMADVNKVMRILKIFEQRWQPSGRVWDIIQELASVGELPLPQAGTPPSQKRTRDADSPKSNRSGTSREHTTSPGTDGSGPRPVAGVRRAAVHQTRDTEPRHLLSTDDSLGLPVHTNELGRLPVHSQSLESNYWYPPNGPPPGDASTSSIQPPQLPMSALLNQPLTGFPPVLQYHSHDDYYNRAPAGSSDSSTAFQGQYYPQGGMPQPLVDQDMMAMWSSAPTGFQLEDWGPYLNSMSEMAHHQQPPHGGQRH